MNKFWLITKHTYLSKIKSKGFLITTAILMLLTAVGANVDNIISFFNNKSTEIGIVADAEITTQMQENLKMADSDIHLKTYSNEEAATTAIKDEEVTGYLLVETTNQIPNGIFKTTAISNERVILELESALQQVKIFQSAQEMNLSAAELDQIFAPVSLESIAITVGENGKVVLDTGAKSEEELAQARGLVYILLFLIYIFVLMYASIIATEVAAEKTSRVMEILISSVPPVQQMFGKIIGVFLLSLTQIIALFAVGYPIIKQTTNTEYSFLNFNHVPISTFIYAVVFFLLGYFLYATIAALLGSLVSRTEDVSQTLQPMMFLVIIGFIIAMSGLATPTAGFITATSYIPFFTPMIMFLRVSMLEIPTWEIAISIIIMLATIVSIAIFGAKVYRGGVLMYGKASFFKNITQALQLTKKK